MATEQVEVVNIETKKATQSLGSLKKEVKDLKDKLLTLQEGSAEYNKVLVEIGDKMHQLKEITRQTNQTSQDFGDKMSGLSKTIGGMSGAASAVVGTMSLLGVEMGDDIKLMKTLQSLMAITSGIQALDAGVKGFKAMTIAIKASVTAMKAKKAATIADAAATEGATVAQHGLNAAIKANPIGAIVAIIMAAVMAVVILTAGVQKLIKAFRQTEDPVQASADALKEYNKEAERMKGKDDYALRMAKAMGKSTAEIRRMRQEQAKSNEQLARAAYLRVLELYNAASKKEKKEMQESLNEAAKALREAKANTIAVQRDISVELAEEATARRKKEEEDRKAAAKKAVADAKARAKAEAEAEKLAQEDAWKRRQAIADKMAAEQNNENVSLQTKLEILKEQQALVEADTAQWHELALQIQQTTAKIEANNAAAAKAAEERRKEALETKLAYKEIFQSRDNAKRAHEIEMEYIRATDELNKNRHASELDALEVERQHQEALFELEREQINQREENLMFQYNNGLIAETEYNAQLIEIQRARLELEEDISAQSVANAKAEAEAKKNINKAYYNAVKGITGDLTSILGTVADTMEQGTQQWKNLKTAEAIISTIAGSIDAFMSALHSGIPYPFNLAAGAASAASVMASGIAQVRTIQNTQINKNAASNTAATNQLAGVSSSAVQGLATDITNVRQTTTASDEANLQDTRVYVLEGDITRAQGNKRTTVENSTF